MKQDVIKDKYFASRNKRDQFNEYCNKFDNIKPKYGFTNESDALSKQLNTFDSKNRNLSLNNSQINDLSKQTNNEILRSQSTLNIEDCNETLLWYQKPIPLAKNRQNVFNT